MNKTDLALEDGELELEDLGMGGEARAHGRGVVQRRALEEEYGF